MVHDSDADEHDHECEPEEKVQRPWSWMHFLALGSNLAGNLSHSLWAFFDDVKDAAQAHVAVHDDTRDAWRSLHADLESLPSTE